MSKPIDIKTGNVFEPLKNNYESSNKEFLTLNSEQVYDILAQRSNDTVTLWFKLQQAWCNNAYKTFKDYDTYLILVYLVNQVFQKFSDRFQFLSYEEFYAKDELVIDKINLIEPTGKAMNRKVVWSHPAFANRNVLVRNDKELASFSLAE